MRPLPCLLAFLAPSLAHAVAPPGPRPLFERDVLPVLQQHCLKCHGPARKGGVDLRSVQAMLRDAGEGPVVVPGKAGDSPLVRQVAEGRMPPGKAPRLSAAQAGLLRDWVAAGAPTLERAAAGSIRPADRRFWAFQPPRRPPLPRVRDGSRV